VREADLSRRRGAKSGFPVPQQTTGREVAKPIGVAEAGGFVPALDRLTVRQISYRYLSEEERIDIADLRRGGLSIRGVAAELGRAPSTVPRELRRNSRRDGTYRPFEAHRWAVHRRARRHRRRIDNNPALCELIAELLAQR